MPDPRDRTAYRIRGGRMVLPPGRTLQHLMGERAGPAPVDLDRLSPTERLTAIRRAQGKKEQS